MNPDIETQIAEIKEMVKENNKILKKIQAGNRWVIIMGFAKWIVYIAILVGTYAVLQPYLNQMIGLYSGIQESADTLSDIKSQTQGIDINSLKELLN
jgi:hypothetical protein